MSRDLIGILITGGLIFAVLYCTAMAIYHKGKLDGLIEARAMWDKHFANSAYPFDR